MHRPREQREFKNYSAYDGDVDDTVEEEAEKESNGDKVKDGNEDNPAFEFPTQCCSPTGVEAPAPPTGVEAPASPAGENSSPVAGYFHIFLQSFLFIPVCLL